MTLSGNNVGENRLVLYFDRHFFEIANFFKVRCHLRSSIKQFHLKGVSLVLHLNSSSLFGSSEGIDEEIVSIDDVIYIILGLFVLSISGTENGNIPNRYLLDGSNQYSTVKRSLNFSFLEENTRETESLYWKIFQK